MDTNVQKRRENKKSLRVKVISLGNAEVGKSCIIKRYCEKRFVPKYLATIGIDYGVTKVQVRDREIKVNIFDMAGHPFFYEVRNEFYKDSQGVILVYDVGLRESFDALDSWLTEMKQEMGSQANMENIIFIVDLTKRRVVDESEGRLWAESRGFHYFETSAQSGEGINEMFQAFFSSITDMCENGGKRPTPEGNVGFTKEQADIIRRIRNSKDSWDMLGVKPGATSINTGVKGGTIVMCLPGVITLTHTPQHQSPSAKGGSQQGIQEVGCTVASRQMCGSRQRGCL
ncbi:dnaJ homolog subfamily C member 27-like isoform X2 [Myxocyprinus asiaticus]|uniref:dnaJ homolog subfamily C member 27-like isoform X2 n=1 Tax=Myxocyprinus asiaticus TaxID=70543 RepID=UPI002223E3AB|nr:dnaJ homolog subfamily C member 27-like isoform X2 [Myxocyprinus asiaticus]